jgi:hypothetical protein
MDQDAAWKALAEFRLLTAHQQEYLEAVAEDLPPTADRESLVRALAGALESRWPRAAYDPLIRNALAAYALLQVEGPDAAAPSSVREVILNILKLRPPFPPRE